MKETIIEILKEHLIVPFEPFNECAEEITAHVFEFMEWLISHCIRAYQPMQSKWYWVLDDGNTMAIFYTHEELYQYWLTNIKNVAK